MRNGENVADSFSGGKTAEVDFELSQQQSASGGRPQALSRNEQLLRCL